MRPIDADGVIEKINDFEITPTTNLFRLLGGVIGIVDNAPTLEPVKRGKWLPTTSEDRMRCSVCDRICQIAVYPWFGGLAKYCPCCGARMDDDNENSNKGT